MKLLAPYPMFEFSVVHLDCMPTKVIELTALILTPIWEGEEMDLYLFKSIYVKMNAMTTARF